VVAGSVNVLCECVMYVNKDKECYDAQQYCPGCDRTSSALVGNRSLPGAQGAMFQLPPSPRGALSVQVVPAFSRSTPILNLPIWPVKIATRTTSTMSPMAATIMVVMDNPCPLSVRDRFDRALCLTMKYPR